MKDIESFSTRENVIKYRDLCRQGLIGPELAKAMGVEDSFLRLWLTAKLAFIRETLAKEKNRRFK